MRCLIVFSILLSFEVSAQWHTTALGSAGIIPEHATNQFIIDPYRNSIWLVNDFGASVIENDGTLKTYRTNELGSLWSGSELKFAFTQDHIYYIRELIGLSSFDNETPQNLFSSQVIEKVFSDQDTVFIYDGGGDSYAHITGVSTTPLWISVGQNFLSRNGRRYGHSGGTLNYIRSNTDVVQFAFDVPGYLLSPRNTFSFSRNSDTLYVGQETGISIVYDDSIVDPILTTNTVNMPSENVLDIQFDMNDNLWAIFGDVNGNAFSLAKLEGNTWTNIYNNSNSPIDFGTCSGLEFDTLNNIWVVDSYGLHTLENINSPNWLGVHEEFKPKFSICPNPSNGTITLELENNLNISQVLVFDMLGKEVYRGSFTKKMRLDIQQGYYILHLFNENGIIGSEKIVFQ